LRAEDKERGRAKLKEIYEAGRADRERRRDEREVAKAEGQAKRAAAAGRKAAAAIAGKKARKPFTFDRAKPAAATKPAPVVIRGDVKVRRFEAGSVEVLAFRSLERAGIKVEQLRAAAGRGHPIDKWKVRGKTYDVHELIRCANEVREARGEEPLISPKREKSA
jgi:hypothetical protein